MELIIWQALAGTLLVSLSIVLWFGLKNIIKISKKLNHLYKIDSETQNDLLNYALANPNPVFGINKSGFIIFSNHGAEVILKEWKVSLSEKIPAEWREVTKQIQLSGKPQTVELNFEKKNFLLCIVPRRDGSANFFAMEITDIKQLEKELENKISYDEQTNLPNRASFKLNLIKQTESAIIKKSKLTLLVIRLDDYFQMITAYGDETAKLVFLEFSKRLSEFAIKSNHIARLGEDQFSVLEAHITTPTAIEEYVKALLEKCSATYRVAGHEIYLSLSVGIAFFPNDGDAPDTLVRNAQLAVNRTSSTKNSYEFFQRGMEEQLQLKRDIARDLRTALSEKQLELHYQPQIDLFQKKLVGCEALIRWKHPEKGYISPFYFITAAEESSIIEQIGEWVLQEACNQIVLWRDQGRPPITVAVNLSGRQILKTNIVAIVQKEMESKQVTGEWLALELTESALVQDKDHAQSTMEKFRAMNLELALDDFGTGYSSLSYLMQFPINKLKIDRSFVIPIDNENDEYAVTKGIIDLGHSMKLKIIAEGVETDAQLKYMYKHKCEIIQGFIFGTAQPANVFVENFAKDWATEIDKHLK